MSWLTEIRQPECLLGRANAVMSKAQLFLLHAAAAINCMLLSTVALRQSAYTESNHLAAVFALSTFGYISYLAFLCYVKHRAAALKESSTDSNPVAGNRELVSVGAREGDPQERVQSGRRGRAPARNSREGDGRRGLGRAEGAAPGDDSLTPHVTSDKVQAILRTLRAMALPSPEHGARGRSPGRAASYPTAPRVRGEQRGREEEDQPGAHGGSPSSGNDEEDHANRASAYDPFSATHAHGDRAPRRRGELWPACPASRRRTGDSELARLRGTDARRDGLEFVPLLLPPRPPPGPQRSGGSGAADGPRGMAPRLADNNDDNDDYDDDDAAAAAPDDGPGGGGNGGGGGSRLAPPRFPKLSIASLTGDECDDDGFGSLEATFRAKRRGGN